MPLDKPRLALLSDYPEENWVSMNFCAEMLLAQLQKQHADLVSVTRFCPPWRRVFQGLPRFGRMRAALNLDRLVNRYYRYPRRLKPVLDSDIFHVVDHSYAHVVHALPGGRTGVFCHDVDAFRCIFAPEEARESKLYRHFARRILSGMQKAAVVFYTTNAVRDVLVQHRLVDPARLVQAPLGVAEEYTPLPAPGVVASAMGRVEGGGRYLFHIGTCWPRKRMDVLLKTAGALCREFADLKLVKVGGEFTPEQKALISEQNLEGKLIHRTHLSRVDVAALYRGAAATLMTSDAEGFGIPIIEALACNSIMVASDLPVLREVGGDAVMYAPVGDVPAWVETVRRVLTSPASAPSAEKRAARSAQFSWQRHADIIWQTYSNLLKK